MPAQTNIHGVTVDGDLRKDCCKKLENLGKIERLTEDLSYRRCRVCECRHFSFNAQPGKIIFRGM